MNVLIQDIMGVEDQPNQGLHKRDIEKLVEGKIQPHYTVSYFNKLNVLGQFNDLLQKANCEILNIKIFLTY